MLDLYQFTFPVELHSNNVKPAVLACFPFRLQIICRQAAQSGLFLTMYAFPGQSVPVAAFCPHFYKNKLLPVNGYYINFPEAAPEVPV
jgi:hypothetical protein